jgi:hypothetical protein
MEPILDNNGQVVGNRPMDLDRLIKGRIAFLEGHGQNVSIGEWTAAQLDVFTKVIDNAVAHIAAQTRTPAHYLIASGNVPAAGYELAEAGLASKTTERTGFATPPLREIYRMMCLAEGNTAKAERVAGATVLWKKPFFRSEAQLMDGLLKLSQVGFPFAWIAEEYGLSPEDVQRVVEMRRDEARDPVMERLARDVAIGAPSETEVEVSEEMAV